MTDSSESNHLAHYGVPGMKWGKRKSARPMSQDAAKAAKLQARVKKSGISNLNNKELEALTKRKELETKYKKVNPSVANRGKQAIKGSLAVAATATTIYSLANSPMVKAGVNAIKKFGNRNLLQLTTGK